VLSVRHGLRFFRNIACAVVAVSLCAPAAHAAPGGLYNDKYAAIVIDANTGKTLFEAKANARRYPASLTKMMTLYILFEAMQAGRISANTPIPVSSYAASRPPTKIGFQAGQKIAAEMAAKALITRSANDVAAAIGEYLGGTERNFARMMTVKARQLGMKNTNFTNASGLPDTQNYSTARDMAILSLALREHFPRQYRLFNTTSFTFRGRNIVGHNKLVQSMQGVDGIKTGYTRMSGFNVASSRRSGGKSIVAVVLGGQTARSRDTHMAALLGRYMTVASLTKKANPLVASRGVAVPALKSVPIPVAKAVAGDRSDTSATVQVAGVEEIIPLPEEAAVPVPVAKAVAVGANDEIVTAQDTTASEIVPLPEEDMLPVPVARAILRSPSPHTTPRDVTALSDREHDSALLTALASQSYTPSAAAAAVDELIMKSLPVPEQKADKNHDPVKASAVDSPKTGWVIQIASLHNQQEARQMLDKAADTVRAVFAEAKPYTQFFEKGGRRYYRARFSGFTSRQSAWHACSELKKADFHCYALKN